MPPGAQIISIMRKQAACEYGRLRSSDRVEYRGWFRRPLGDGVRSGVPGDPRSSIASVTANGPA